MKTRNTKLVPERWDNKKRMPRRDTTAKRDLKIVKKSRVEGFLEFHAIVAQSDSWVDVLLYARVGWQENSTFLGSWIGETSLSLIS